MDDVRRTVDEDVFIDIGRLLCRAEGILSKKFIERKFKSMFGVSPFLCNALWYRLRISKNADFFPRHLLMGLCFLKLYAVEHVYCSIFNVSEKTIRHYQWMVISEISKLKLVSCCFLFFQSNFLSDSLE